jgi:hypothetical protein
VKPPSPRNPASSPVPEPGTTNQHTLDAHEACRGVRHLRLKELDDPGSFDVAGEFLFDMDARKRGPLTGLVVNGRLGRSCRWRGVALDGGHIASPRRP